MIQTDNEYGMPDSELKSMLHPTETSRFILALIVAIPVAIALCALVVVSKGTILLFLAIVLPGVWFSLRLLKACLVGSSVRVSADNFCEIHEILLEVKNRLDYHKDVEIYITEGGSFNALLYKFFQTRFILLNSDVVTGIPLEKKRAQMVWLIARFIGALKARHFRLQLLAIIINSIEKLYIFNLFILPYERSMQYSGDQIGLVVCEDLGCAIDALGKFMVGRDLSRRIRLKGLMKQAHEVHRSLFALFAKLLSTHPHMTDRYLNLLAFARYKCPREFERYIENSEDVTFDDIGFLLPGYFPASGAHPRTFSSPTADKKEFPVPAFGRPAAELIGVEGPLTGTRVRVEKTLLKLGADQNNDIVIDDAYVSGSHAWLSYIGGDLILADQQSANGTWLNGREVCREGAKVRPGDVIRIGLSTFEVTIE